ncbi:MAG: hypothetical protein ACQERE_02220 [Pseudomonadota bacterium]
MLTIISLKALAIWFVILLLAIANGGMRESVLMPLLGTPIAFILSGLLLSALIVGVTYSTLPWLHLGSATQFWLLGCGWLALTLVFEFSFGLWQGKSWPVMLEAYTFRDGNLWPVVLATTLAAPYLAAKLRGWV